MSQSIVTFIQHSFRSPNCDREEKEIKEIQIGKQVRLSLFADDMMRDTQNILKMPPGNY